jgi:hypothetical protein
VKVLFSALHLAYFRNFESVVRELAARGHQVHLTADEPERFGGQELAERLAAEHPGISWGMLPALDEEEPWFDTARRLRIGLDYVRVVQPEYAGSPKLRLRTWVRAPRVVRWAAATAPALTLRTLTGLERLMPASEALDAYLAEHAPDIVVLASLTYSRSQQVDLLKAARARGIPVAAAIMSWDHLSRKALIHLQPDLVLVWNEVQKHEAVEMHGLDPDRVAVTGAQCYDEWFTRPPSRDRETFCAAMGLRADRPFVLWVHSALSPAPDPPEPVLVTRWIEALRTSADPRLREAGVLVRPHPERTKEWADVDLTRFDNVAFSGRNPIDPAAKSDYFDALYHSSAVAGLVTSAFLEAAVVGRPVLTFTLPEYRIHQEEMRHFQYLRSVAGGVLYAAPDMATHLAQLADALGGAPDVEARNRRFVEAFIRPAGLQCAATPLFVDALERLRGAPPVTAPSASPLLRRAVAATASHESVVTRYLLNDTRNDAWDAHRDEKRRILVAKRAAKAGRQQAKVRRRQRRQRRDALMLKGKEAKSALRNMRFRTAMLAHRVLALAGIGRGPASGGGEP